MWVFGRVGGGGVLVAAAAAVVLLIIVVLLLSLRHPAEARLGGACKDGFAWKASRFHMCFHSF